MRQSTAKWLRASKDSRLLKVLKHIMPSIRSFPPSSHFEHVNLEWCITTTHEWGKTFLHNKVHLANGDFPNKRNNDRNYHQDILEALNQWVRRAIDCITSYECVEHCHYSQREADPWLTVISCRGMTPAYYGRDTLYAKWWHIRTASLDLIYSLNFRISCVSSIRTTFNHRQTDGC